MHPVSQRIPDTFDDLKEAYVGQAMELYQTQTENEKLKVELAWYRRQVFGCRSEKSVVDENRLSLESIREDEKGAEHKEPEKAEYQITVKRAKPGKKPIPKNLPHRRIEQIPGKDKLTCS